MKEPVALILGAGKGTRMKSDRAKVLHELCGRPMLAYVVDMVRDAGAGRVLVVVGHQKEEVKERLRDAGLEWVDQDEQLGTGHAVMMARPLLQEYHGEILTLSGDMPLVKPETLAGLLERHRESGAGCTLLTSRMANPAGFGRVLRDSQGGVDAIVEERDASAEQRAIREVNCATYCFDATALFDALERIATNNVQTEYYLTDVVSILKRQGARVEAVEAADSEEVMGVNSQQELQQVEEVLRRRLKEQKKAGA